MKKNVVLHLCDLGQASPQCPQVLENPAGKPDQQIEIQDDFGGTVKMSRGQFATLVVAAKQGTLDDIK